MKVTKMISRKMAGGILLGFLAVAGIVTGSQGSVTVYAAEELQGSGTAEDPYVITGSEDLWKFAEIVKASSDRNECAKVADGVTEIDTTVRGEKKDLTWNPIGDSSGSYKGVFDGNGAEITIHADRSINNNAGLFGILGSGGEIRNVTTAGSSKGWDSVGGICGQACSDAKIVNCNNKADITAQGGQAGGLAGYASSAQIESDTSISNTGAVTGTANVGGLVGQASGGMKVIVHEGILNSGAITAKSSGYVGGLIGYADLASIQADADIINTGKISSMGSNTSMGAGGLIGYGIDISIISRNGMLQNKGEVTAAITSVGGIGGHMTSSDNSNCQIQAAKGVINTGRITGKNSVEQADLSDAVFVYELTPGEGAENGIAASKDGAVILTNRNCYLLRANNGVEAVWCTPYESVGAKVSGENDKTTGGGLAWGGGCSPSLTPDLVMFTDNADPVKLLALDMKTGEIVASMPVLDDLPEGYQVAIENSAIVYDDSEGTVSTIVCNWFGAGSAGLADPNSDSSIQSYANIYDTNWLTKGNSMIAPGVERVDTVKTDSGYEMKSIWSRNDLSDTSILKLSTATGYIYGYVQDLESGMWQYIILDFETGETIFTMDVSNKFGYNNMAIGMYAGNSGNALYCPTGYLELLCLQDRFVYLPEMPYRKVDLDKAARNVLTQEQFEQDGGVGTVASWRNTVTVENVHPNTTVSFRMNNLSGSVADLKLYAYGADGKLAEVSKELWTITDEAGSAVDKLSDGTLYELRVSVADGGAFDLSETEKEIKISVVLAK